MSRRRNQQAPVPSVKQPPARRGLPWGKLFLLGLAGLLAVAWFAPTIVMQTRLRDVVLQKVMPELPARIGIRSASAGWLSSVQIRGFTASDEKGQEVLSAATVRTDKNLVTLLLEPQQLGTIRIEQPKLALVLREDGSNLEDLLKPLLSGPSTGRRVGCTVEIVDGTVSASQAGTALQWQLHQFNASVVIPRDPTSPMVAKFKTQASSPATTTASLAAELEWKPAGATATGDNAGWASSQVSAAVHSADFPLEIVTHALHRAGMDMQLAGLLTTEASLTSSNPALTAKFDQLAVRNLFVSSTSLLGTDQIQLASLSGTGEISRNNDQWLARNVKLESEVATLTASGSGPAIATASVSEACVHAFRGGTWEVHGTLDVARLAAMIPATLRLREGTHVSSGQVAVGLVSQAATDGHLWNVDLQASDLAAIHAGSALEWKRPLIVKAAVRELPAGVVIDQVTCDSSFLQLAGAGTPQQGQFRVTGDLSQFVQEIGRFIDLDPVRAAGTFQGQIEWKPAGTSSLALTGSGSATAFELTYASQRPWQEPQLDVKFESNARLADGKVAQVDRGIVEVQSGSDTLEATLLQPVVGPFSDATWPCHFRLTGDLERWLARIQLFAPLHGWQFAGDDLVLEGDLRGSKSRVEVTATKGSVKDLLASRSGLNIREPALQLETTAAYDIAGGELTSPLTTVAGSTIALRADNTRWLWTDNQIALDGDIHYRANLDRLSQWLRDARQSPTSRVEGEATGAVRLAYDRGATQADATASVTNFKYWQLPVAGPTNNATISAASWQERWSEPRLELAVRGSLDANGGRAAIEKLEIAGDSLSLGAAGEIRRPFEACELQLNGQYAYDLSRLADRFRGSLGPNVHMRGTGQRAFSVRGPLYAEVDKPESVRQVSATPNPTRSFAGLAVMLAQASVGWEQLAIHGFEVGPGEVETKLEGGSLAVSPINLPVGEGKIEIAPRIDVRQTPYVATLEPGTIVDRVRISPEMCRSWLKYLAPIMADATAAEGNFSVAVDAAQFPISDPTGGNIQGTLVIHSAQIGPGPLSREILAIAQLIKSVVEKRPFAPDQLSYGQWLEMPEQTLNLQVADHRIYHRDMRFTVKDVAVKTSGWVGVDQQIALVAEIPVRDEWVAQDRYLASLKGQVIRLPISGTMSQPQVDRTALRELTRQTVINAGSNLLQNEINRGLNRLFQPNAPPPGTNPQPAPR